MPSSPTTPSELSGETHRRNPLGEMCSRGRLGRVLACLRGRYPGENDDGGGGKMTIGPVQLLVLGFSDPKAHGAIAAIPSPGLSGIKTEVPK